MRLINIDGMIINGDQIATIKPIRVGHTDGRPNTTEGCVVRFIDDHEVRFENKEAWESLVRMAGRVC